jgi:TonB-linked SusC/RagA family outer membrane protein
MQYYRPGISITRYANDLITWEVANKLNLGVELSLFDELHLLVDYFEELRENILQTRSDIPSTMGLVTIPQANVGVAKGHGVEAELKYQKNFTNDIWIMANTNFTYATSKYRQFEEPNYADTPWKSKIGQKLSQEWGYIAERFFIDDEEANNAPKQFGTYGAGDIKYKDINNDGVINTDDMVPIGFPTVPEIIWGSGVTVGIHNFDFSCFFQGSARSSFFISPSHITPFINNGQRALMQIIADDHWSESNRDLHAFWPRLSASSISNNVQRSTHWLRNGDFVRLKSLEIGYTLPGKLTSKVHLQSMRLYVSGNNLFVWSKFKLWDPEMAGNGLGYPVQRILNLGINVNI